MTRDEQRNRLYHILCFDYTSSENQRKEWLESAYKHKFYHQMF